jgi:4-hydroxybenzoate polyprenyltransferase
MLRRTAVKQLLAIIALMRPKQWVKNIFVFAVVIFSGLVADIYAITHTLIAFASFCLASSSIYCLNDYHDVEEDRLHPKKSKRPLAAGHLPVMAGLLGFVSLSLASVALSLELLGKAPAVVIALYLLLNVGYSLGLKHLVIIDVLIISAGFVLRILAGATALSVMPSAWLMLCGVTISLFLGFTKRRAEVVMLGEEASKHRPVLEHYSTGFLDQMISIVTAATVVLYALYTVDDKTVALVGSRMLVLSVPLVLYGIFRYLYLVYHTQGGGDPTRAVFTDGPMLATGFVWAGLCLSIILWGREIGRVLF